MKKSRSPRIGYETKISHDVVIPDILYDGKIFNISSGGIYFESNEQIEIGDEISVTVQRLDGGEMTFDVGITRREIISKGAYRFGYGAIAVEPQKKLVQILDNDSTPKPQKIEDRRQHSRFDYNKILNVRYSRGEFSVWIKNISPGGAFFQTGLKLPVGKRLTIKMGGKKTGYIRRKGRIVRISEAGFGIKFDCQKIFFDQRVAKRYELPEVKMDRKTFELEMMRAKTFMMTVRITTIGRVMKRVSAGGLRVKILEPMTSMSFGCPWPIQMTTCAAIVAGVIMPDSIFQIIDPNETVFTTKVNKLFI